MDKSEVGILVQQITKAYNDKDYKTAATIAKKIDWSKIKDWVPLAMMIDVQEQVGDIEEARDMAILAYNRNLGGRQLLYRLTEIFIKLGDFDNAEGLYEEYAKLAKHNSNRYILKYHLLRAKKAPVKQQIKVLEDFRSSEIDEHYMYRLAQLYTKSGDEEKAIKVCDDITLWFANGKYVTGAVNLKKRLGAKLTLDQERIYSSSKVKEEELEKTRQMLFTEQLKSARSQADAAKYAVRKYDEKTGESVEPTASVEEEVIDALHRNSENAGKEFNPAEEYGKEAVLDMSAKKRGGFGGFFKGLFGKNDDGNEFFEKTDNEDYYADIPDTNEERRVMKDIPEDPIEKAKKKRAEKARAVQDEYGNLYEEVVSKPEEPEDVDLDRLVVHHEDEESKEASNRGKNKEYNVYLDDEDDDVESYFVNDDEKDVPEETNTVTEEERTPVTLEEMLADEYVKEEAAELASEVIDKVPEDEEEITEYNMSRVASEEKPLTEEAEKSEEIFIGGIDTDAIDSILDENKSLVSDTKKPEIELSESLNNMISKAKQRIDIGYKEILEHKDLSTTRRLIDESMSESVRADGSPEESLEGQLNLADWIDQVREKKYADRNTKEFSKSELERALDAIEEKSQAYDSLIEEKRLADVESKQPYNEAVSKLESRLADSARSARTDLDIRTGKAQAKAENIAKEEHAVTNTAVPKSDEVVQSVKKSISADCTNSEKYNLLASAFNDVEGAVIPKVDEAPVEVLDAASVLFSYFLGGNYEPKGTGRFEGKIAHNIASSKVEPIKEAAEPVEEVAEEADEKPKTLSIDDLDIDDEFNEIWADVNDEILEMRKRVEAGLSSATRAAIEEEKEAEKTPAVPVTDTLSSSDTRELSSTEALRVAEKAEESRPRTKVSTDTIVDPSLDGVDKSMLKTMLVHDDAKVVEEKINENRKDYNNNEPVASLLDREAKKFDALFAEFYNLPGVGTAIKEFKKELPNDLRRSDASRGNIIVAGSSMSDKSGLSKAVARAIEVVDSNNKRKVVRTTGASLNKHGIEGYEDTLNGNVLIIEGAGCMVPAVTEQLIRTLKRDKKRMFVILEDTDAELGVLLKFNPELEEIFNHKMVLRQYSVNELVDICKEFAKREGYKVSDDALLALYLTVDKLHSRNEAITVEDMNEFAESAIARAKKRAKRGHKKGNTDPYELLEEDFKI